MWLTVTSWVGSQLWLVILKSFVHGSTSGSFLLLQPLELKDYSCEPQCLATYDSTFLLCPTSYLALPWCDKHHLSPEVPLVLHFT